MLRRNFLQLLACVPCLGWVRPEEPDLDALLESALANHEFVPPVRGCAESPEKIRAYIAECNRLMQERWVQDWLDYTDF